MVKQPKKWQWSSAKVHIEAKDDILVQTSPLLERMNISWESFLLSDVKTKQINEFRKHERTGRPLGGESSVEKLEVALGRNLKLNKPGLKEEICRVPRDYVLLFCYFLFLIFDYWY